MGRRYAMQTIVTLSLSTDKAPAPIVSVLFYHPKPLRRKSFCKRLGGGKSDSRAVFPSIATGRRIRRRGECSDL
jgi:hypothetical protein